MTHTIRPGRKTTAGALAEQRDQVTALFLRHDDRIRRMIAARLLPEDKHLADDLAQDVWLRLWQYVSRGDTIERPAGLLATMARCRVAHHYRAARTRREQSTDYADAAAASCLPAVASAEAEALAVATVRELVAA